MPPSTQPPPALDRRAATRVPVDLEVDCVSDSVHLFAMSRDVSPDGVFVRTLDPIPAGSRVTVHLAGQELAPPGAPPRELVLEGVVAWANPYRPGALGTEPGIGIRFVAVDDRTRDVLTQLVRRIAWPPR